MTDVQVKDNGRRRQYTAGAGETIFVYPFLIFEDTDLQVYQTPVGQVPNPIADLLTLNVDYTVTGVLNEDGGTIVLIVPAAAGDIITIESDIADEQLVDLSTGGEFKASTINFVHDKAVILIQQVRSLLETRGLTYIVTDNLDDGDTTLPKLPANTGAGIPLWTKNNAGNLVAGILVEGEDCSTLRSELESETQVAPGAQNVGFFDVDKLLGTTVDLVIKDILENIKESSIHYNYIINGDFGIWQRGLNQVFTAVDSGYTADRWLWIQNSGTTELSRESALSNANSTPFFVQIDRSVAAGGFTTYEQRIENISLFADRTISISFQTNLGSPSTLSVDLEAVQFFGSGGGGSPTVITPITTLTLTDTGQQLHTITFDVPSIVGKTLGAAGDEYFGFLFDFDGSTTFILDFFEVSIAVSNRIHLFNPRTLQQEIALCERFFQKSYRIDSPPGTSTLVGRELISINDVTNDGYSVDISVKMPTRMRAIPTVNPFDTGGVIDRVNTISGTTAAAAGNISDNSFEISGGQVTAVTVRQLFFHWIAQSEL